MIVHLSIHYITHEGEFLVLHTKAGEHPMTWSEGDVWRAECDAQLLSSYSFCVTGSDTVLRREWGPGHSLHVESELSEIFLVERWEEQPSRRSDFSSLLQNTCCKHQRNSPAQLLDGFVRVEVKAACVRSGESLLLSGSHELLGAWDTAKALEMTYVGDCTWQVDIPAVCARYKFITRDQSGFVRWEEGEDRVLPAVSSAGVLRVAPLRMQSGWRGAGTAVPVFSLRSRHSSGVGEFSDLKLMAQWCAVTRQKIIQILPVNDTTMWGTWQDSYPYNANSTFALNPLYIRLEEVGSLTSDEEAESRRLNSMQSVDYEGVMKLKWAVLERLFNEQYAQLQKSTSLRTFLSRNESWLPDYALYCALRDRFHTPDFREWGEFSDYAQVKWDSLPQELVRRADFYRFVQYHLDRQLREAVEYCHSLGVALKGDVPIGISPLSVDAWSNPGLFIMDSSAGAPPDDFSAKGQNWGFPIYNWPEMEKDGYSWWKARFAKMAEYFDAYRIDHILGFFRIWEVPLDAASALLGEFNPSLPYTEEQIRAFGVDFKPERDVAPDFSSENVLWLRYRHGEGYFPRISPFSEQAFLALDEEQKRAFAAAHDDFYYRRHNEFWKEVAQKRLGMLVSTTSMLTCGEDLGMIPACVPEVMAGEQILSLEIERMPKAFGREFADLDSYAELSVATTSTHDMNPLRAWWEENPELTQRYYNHVLCREGKAPAQATGDICRQILLRHLSTSSMLCILPLQDWLAQDETFRQSDANQERINIPANPRHYWRYRMHLGLEKLLEAESLNDSIVRMIESTGR